MPVMMSSNTAWYLMASPASMPISSWAFGQKPLPCLVLMSYVEPNSMPFRSPAIFWNCSPPMTVCARFMASMYSLTLLMAVEKPSASA